MEKDIVLESDRLYIRRVIDKDYKHLYNLSVIPQVMKYLKTDGFKPPEPQYLYDLIDRTYRRSIEIPGMGLWAIKLKDDDSFIGLVFLQPYREIEDGVELGYRLYPQFWRKGYCSEICREIIDHAFNIGLTQKIVATVHRENRASIGVLEKLGFKRKSEILLSNKPSYYYELESVL